MEKTKTDWVLSIISAFGTWFLAIGSFLVLYKIQNQPSSYHELQITWFVISVVMATGIAVLFTVAENWKIPIIVIGIITLSGHLILAAVVEGLLAFSLLTWMTFVFMVPALLVGLALGGGGGGGGGDTAQTRKTITHRDEYDGYTGTTGHTGRSEQRGDKREHYDQYGRYTGYSVRQGDKLVHYNENGKYKGESK